MGLKIQAISVARSKDAASMLSFAFCYYPENFGCSEWNRPMLKEYGLFFVVQTAEVLKLFAHLCLFF